MLFPFSTVSVFDPLHLAFSARILRTETILSIDRTQFSFSLHDILETSIMLEKDWNLIIIKKTLSGFYFIECHPSFTSMLQNTLSSYAPNQHDTCYTLQLGKSMQCNGIASKDDDDTTLFLDCQCSSLTAEGIQISVSQFKLILLLEKTLFGSLVPAPQYSPPPPFSPSSTFLLCNIRRLLTPDYTNEEQIGDTKPVVVHTDLDNFGDEYDATFDDVGNEYGEGFD
ncbi:hypothetical protein KSP40_PGU008174 [Platanthera guangdongensis]|uniref:Uncharacterized protein n=1 Tax=Platanthera guangdongensis TaxID=2320717 RepID=A0ABR2MXU3_9ASPA